MTTSNIKAKRCREKNEFYQRKFRDIAPMTSNELAALQRIEATTDGNPYEYCYRYATNDGSPIVVVDVRSEAERSVSIIPGAISLVEFEDTVTALPSNAVVVCYCTIGYRSGLEARRLKEKYSLEGRIRNLDGIVSYTHADPLALVDIDDNSSNRKEKPHLVDPTTGEKSDMVHIYGNTWNCVDEAYETTHFSFPVLAVRSVGVGLLSSLRCCQHIVYIIKQCCCKTRRTLTDTVESSTSRPMQVECRNAQFM